MCQMPTGTGKTIVLSEIISQTVSDSNNYSSPHVLVIAHRKEIIEQIKHNLKKSGLEEQLNNKSIVVECIQKLRNTLKANIQSYNSSPSPSLVIIDEAHHATARTYRMLWEAFPEAHFLGLTATPCRLIKEGFTDLFDRLICSYSVKQFIDKGWLADYDYVVIRPDGEMRKRIDSLKKRGVDGDYQQKELGTVMDNRACIEHLYDSYKKYADGRQGIIYAVNKEHAHHIASYYADKIANASSDLIVAVVDSATPKKMRERINKEYRSGKIKILVNCDIYSEGVDVPDCSFIQLARPTLSLSKYIQQVGRGLRPNKDGRHTLILDNVGMYYLFGLPDADRDWHKMFREGQVVRPCNNANNGYVHESRNTEMSIDDGHNLDMCVVDSTSKKRKVEIGRIKCKGIYIHTFTRNGLVIDRNLGFIEYHDFLDGFCWMQNSQGDKYFFDDYGNYIVSLPRESEICPLGFVRINKKGFASYYDLKARIHMTCLPDVHEYGDAEFIKFDGALHLRNSRLASIGFKKSHIKVRDGYVLAIDKSQNESYLIQDEGRVVYRVLGQEDDLTTILWDIRFASTLHKMQSGMITIIHQNENTELYEKWYGVRRNLSEIKPLDGERIYTTEGDTPSLLEKDGLYGWYHGNKIRCKAKFKEIVDSSLYNFFVLVVDKKGRKILVNNYGHTVYDRYEIDRIDGEKLLLLPSTEIQECLKLQIDHVYVDLSELISKSQEHISEIITYKDLSLRARHDDNGLTHISPDDEELRYIHLSDMENKRYYLMFTDATDKNGRKIIYAEQEYYYVSEMHTENYMYIEHVKTHKQYMFIFSTRTYSFEIRERKENAGWNVQNTNESSSGVVDESIKKFLQRYSKLK